MKGVKNNICPRKHVLFVSDHLHGAKNGQKIGTTLNIVAKNAEGQNRKLSLVQK